MSKSLEASDFKPDVENYSTFSNWLIIRARKEVLQHTNSHSKRDDLAADVCQHLFNHHSFPRQTHNLCPLLSAEPSH